MSDPASKPLLIIPPAPARWDGMEQLLAHEAAPWLADLHKRVAEGLPGAADALAVVREGARKLACACLRRRRDVGVLSHLYTHPDHRRRGHALRLLQTLLSWFDMTGGRWLYLAAPPFLFEALLQHVGFRVLHQASVDGEPQLLLCRRPASVEGTPLDAADGEPTITGFERADLPLLVCLLQYRHGPDPRVAVHDSAAGAAALALELTDQQDRGVSVLRAAWRGEQLVALGSVAVDQLGQRTYAMLLPFGEVPPALRSDLIETAGRRGYTQVDFPMEALAPHPAAG